MKLPVLASIAALVVTLASGSVISAIEQRNLTGHIIPVTDVGCTGDTLDVNDVAIAQAKMVLWDQTGKQVHPKNWHPEWYRTAVWYLCNCKYVWKDGIPEAELEEAAQLIRTACGYGQTGWVWSQPWQKSYNLGSTEAIRGKKPSAICPERCVWSHLRAPEDGQPKPRPSPRPP